MGVGDFVLLSEITMHAFIENLKLRWSVFLGIALASTPLILLSRFEKGRIYTYIGEVSSLCSRFDQVQVVLSSQTLGTGERQSVSGLADL